MMKQLFYSHAVQPRDMRFAYPIIQLTFPDITLSQWLHFAREAARVGKGGLMAVSDSRNHIHALYRYQVEMELPLQHVLRVFGLVIVRLPGHALDAALFDGFDTLASQSRCHTISLELATGGRCGTGRGMWLSDVRYWPYATTMRRYTHSLSK